MEVSCHTLFCLSVMLLPCSPLACMGKTTNRRLVKHEFKKPTERKSMLGLDKLAAVKREEEIRQQLEEAKRKLKGDEEWDTNSHLRPRTTSEQSGFTPTPDRRRREEDRRGSERRSERGNPWDRSERRWYEESERRDRNRDYDRDRYFFLVKHGSNQHHTKN